MKQIGNILTGLALIIVGAVIFLQNVSVTGFSLYNGGINVGAVVILLTAISFIAMVVKADKLTVTLFGCMMLLFLIIIIMSIRIHVRRMTALTLVLILGLICTGIAMVVKGFIVTDRKEEN